MYTVVKQAYYMLRRFSAVIERYSTIKGEKHKIRQWCQKWATGDCRNGFHWKFLAQTGASRCQGLMTFGDLNLSPTVECAVGLVKPKLMSRTHSHQLWMYLT